MRLHFKVRISQLQLSTKIPNIPYYPQFQYKSTRPISKIALAMAENTHYRTYANPAPQARLLDFTTMSKRFASSYPNHFALVIDNCFTPDECENLIALAESDEAGWQIAQVNVGGGQQVTALDMRNSGRIIRDDFDMAGFIYTRVRPWLDELGVGVLKRGDQGGGWGEVLASVRNPLKRGEGGRWREVMASVRNPLKAARLVGERWEMTRYVYELLSNSLFLQKKCAAGLTGCLHTVVRTRECDSSSMAPANTLNVSLPPPRPLPPSKAQPRCHNHT